MDHEKAIQEIECLAQRANALARAEDLARDSDKHRAEKLSKARFVVLRRLRLLARRLLKEA